MDDLIKNLVSYLNDILGLLIKPEPWHESENLPYYLREPYTFYVAEMFNHHCLLMFVSSPSNPTPATIENHIRQVKKDWSGDVVCVLQRVKSYERQRLIDHRISFIVPGNQMYLPQLGLDLREYFKKTRSKIPHISPSTQAFIIYALINGTEHKYTSKDLTEKLQYTPMTISRAFDEIQLLELASCHYEGRERILRFNRNKKDLWVKAQTYMSTPVKRRAVVDYTAKKYLGIQAGLTALAHYSMLASPGRPVFAVSANYWNKVKHNPEIREFDIAEIGTYDVEIWSYNPALLTSTGVVDPFSLYLSMRKDSDERVQSSLNQMLEDIAW